MLIPSGVRSDSSFANKKSKRSAVAQPGHVHHDNTYVNIDPNESGYYSGNGSESAPGAWLAPAIIGAFAGAVLLLWLFVKWYKRRVRTKVIPELLGKQKKKNKPKKSSLKRSQTGLSSTTTIGNLGTPHSGTRMQSVSTQGSSSSATGGDEPSTRSPPPFQHIREPPPVWTPLTRSQTRSGVVASVAQQEPPNVSSLPTYEQVRSDSSSPLPATHPPPVNFVIAHPRMVDAEIPFTGWEQRQEGEHLPPYQKYERDSENEE